MMTKEKYVVGTRRDYSHGTVGPKYLACLRHAEVVLGLAFGKSQEIANQRNPHKAPVHTRIVYPTSRDDHAPWSAHALAVRFKKSSSDHP